MKKNELMLKDNKQKPSIVAMIPARAGSVRIPAKNIKCLNGHPLIAYSIASALDSGIFDAVVVSTDSQDYANIATYYGAEVPCLRPPEFAQKTSPDFEFVNHMINFLNDLGKSYDCYSILRPTSPFRQPETIQKAWKNFLSHSEIDSIRAVEKCSQHPCKMWIAHEDTMSPLLPMGPKLPPWHSQQYPSLPEVYVQNASLEIAWSCVVTNYKNISGYKIAPYYSTGYEGFDINKPFDLVYAEYLVENDMAALPGISKPSYFTTHKKQSIKI